MMSGTCTEGATGAASPSTPPQAAQTTHPPLRGPWQASGPLTCEGTVLCATRSYEIERHVGGATDILVREGPVGPCVALADHALADKVDSTHDEEGQDDADHRPDGAAVGWSVV